ncbi:MAG: hypothetical protein ABIK96_00775 [bacterium]
MAKRKPTSVVEFMFNELGGKDEVLKKYLVEKLSGMASKGATVGKVLEMGEEEGWKDEFLGMRFSEFLEASRSVSKEPKKAPRKKVRSTRKRLTGEELDALKDKISIWLNDNPWSKKKEITEGVGLSGNIAPVLKKLVEAGVIKSHGEKAKTCYAMAGSRKAPPE